MIFFLGRTILNSWDFYDRKTKIDPMGIQANFKESLLRKFWIN